MPGRPDLDLIVLAGSLAVARLDAADAVPAWATTRSILSAIVRSADELSVLTADAMVPLDVRAERGYRAIKVRGPLPFGSIGIFASIADPIAEAGIGIFALSTYDTDYVLVKEHDLAASIEALRRAGHRIAEPGSSGAIP